MLTPLLTLIFALSGVTQDVLRPLDVFELEWAAEPEVAPDGRTVVYVRGGYDRLLDRGRGDVWRVDVASGAQRPLVQGASSPRLSPDGARLAYLADAGARSSSCAGSTQVRPCRSRACRARPVDSPGRRAATRSRS